MLKLRKAYHSSPKNVSWHENFSYRNSIITEYREKTTKTRSIRIETNLDKRSILAINSTLLTKLQAIKN
jgi:hypothetical protein